MKNSYTVYIVECADKTLYTGWTNDLSKRIYAHNNSATGAKYTRGRRPVKLVYKEVVPSLKAALKREAAIKRLSRKEKMVLVGFVC
ncbi:MAG TPA: GIY-YIG nuclease family protein [Candidatus Udaeobacter sp.]|nr:GIY-YIG nuclease family protein [Candidatus Udaeobacter sp.]